MAQPPQVIRSIFSEDAVGIQFYRKAAHLLPELIVASSLESVQACLLIGRYTLPVDAFGLAYIYLNLALTLAIQNGVHRKHPANDTETRIRETRNRVWWALYTIEQCVPCRILSLCVFWPWNY